MKMKISQKTQQHRMIRKMKQNSPCPKRCRHGDRLRRFMKNMGHPSNRTLVRMLRLGGAKRRIILAAARHRCCACEAQKRPAGPIVSRSPTSFVVNDVVGLDLFFLNTYEKNTLPAMNIVCWGAALQRVIPLRDRSGETLRNAYRNNWLRSYGRPRILVVDRSAACAQAFSRQKLKAMRRDSKRHRWRHRGGMARQNVRARIGMKTTTR